MIFFILCLLLVFLVSATTHHVCAFLHQDNGFDAVDKVHDHIKQHFKETDDIFSQQQQDAHRRHNNDRRERSLTGRLSFDNDLSRLRHGAIAQHSFVPPLLQLGGIGSGLTTAMDSWEVWMSAVVSDHLVRLTPLDSSREGVFWNTVASSSYSWTAHIGFRIHGAGSALGGDGFALWYQRAGQVSRLQTKGGAAHGLDPALMHDGIGIIFDTFDNDGSGDNPAVIVVKTSAVPRASGGATFNANVDSPPDVQLLDPSSDYKNQQVGQCYRPFRNTEMPEHVVVRYNYRKQRLHVSFADQHCVVAEDIKLLPLGFFGFSAHTGGVSDMHDVHYFILLSNDDEEEEHALGNDPDAVSGDQQQPPRDVVAQDVEDHGTAGQIDERRHPVHGKKVLPGKVKYNRELDLAEQKKWSGYVEPKEDPAPEAAGSAAGDDRSSDKTLPVD